MTKDSGAFREKVVLLHAFYKSFGVNITIEEVVRLVAISFPDTDVEVGELQNALSTLVKECKFVPSIGRIWEEIIKGRKAKRSKVFAEVKKELERMGELEGIDYILVGPDRDVLKKVLDRLGYSDWDIKPEEF